MTASLCQQGKLNQAQGRKLRKQIKKSLKEDRQKRTSDAGLAIEKLLHERDFKEAWRQLEGWYRAAKEQVPKPCYESMDVQTKEQEELYKEHEPPGEPIPITLPRTK